MPKGLGLTKSHTITFQSVGFNDGICLGEGNAWDVTFTAKRNLVSKILKKPFCVTPKLKTDDDCDRCFRHNECVKREMESSLTKFNQLIQKK